MAKSARNMVAVLENDLPRLDEAAKSLRGLAADLQSQAQHLEEQASTLRTRVASLKEEQSAEAGRPLPEGYLQERRPYGQPPQESPTGGYGMQAQPGRIIPTEEEKRMPGTKLENTGQVGGTTAEQLKTNPNLVGQNDPTPKGGLGDGIVDSEAGEVGSQPPPTGRTAAGENPVPTPPAQGVSSNPTPPPSSPSTRSVDEGKDKDKDKSKK